jgi:hypothetical protein
VRLEDLGLIGNGQCSALVSEAWDTAGRKLWGNLPQAYSHVGLIHAAFAASPRWSDVL